MVALLQTRTWANLRATAHAYGLRFDTNQTRRNAFTRLHREIITEGRLRRTMHELSQRERDALRALQMAGGMMPLYEFIAAFGDIRPYRPWREDSPKYPWKRPISVAEKLWHLALIEITREGERRVVLPDEVGALLPPLPRPQPLTHVRVTSESGAAALIVDMAAFLGVLLAKDVRPIRGRWLSLAVMRTLNTHLSIPESLCHVRSESQSGRIRFLHRLAESAGFVACVGGRLIPTATAWPGCVNRMSGYCGRRCARYCRNSHG